MKPKKVAGFSLLPQTRLATDIVENARLSEDFLSSGRLRPIIFSHGNKYAPNHYTGLLSEFASRGYIVFAPYHTDGSCSYTEKKGGTPIFAEEHLIARNKFFKKRWTEKVAKRSKEIIGLYNEVAEMSHWLKILIFG